MGIIRSSSSSFVRFRIVDPIPNEFWGDLPGKLKQFAFVDIDDIPEERGVGWTSIDDMLDTGFTGSVPEKGAYIAFALRLDTRRIPPAVLNKHVALALREEKKRNAETGKTFISRERRRELKDQVRIRLMQRFLPIPAVFDVVWNTRTGIIYFGSTQSKAIDLFLNYFETSFGLHLEALAPYALASGMVAEAEQVSLDTLSPTEFV